MPSPLDLIAADALGHRAAGGVEVALQELIGERAHGQPGGLPMLEHDGAVARDRNGRMQFVAAAPQHP